MPTNPEPKFDVIVYQIESRKVSSIFGEKLPLKGDFHSAESGQRFLLKCISRYYTAMIVPTGKYREGDIIHEPDSFPEPT